MCVFNLIIVPQFQYGPATLWRPLFACVFAPSCRPARLAGRLAKTFFIAFVELAFVQPTRLVQRPQRNKHPAAGGPSRMEHNPHTSSWSPSVSGVRGQPWRQQASYKVCLSLAETILTVQPRAFVSLTVSSYSCLKLKQMFNDTTL